MQCHKLFTREEFSLHLPDCRQNMMRQSTINAATVINPIKIRVLECRQVKTTKPTLKFKDKLSKSQNRYDE